MSHKLEKPANDFLETHKKWAEQTKEEIRIIRTRDFKASTQVLKNTNSLSEHYQRQLKFLFDHAAELKDLPDDLKNKLRTAQEEFQTVSGELHAELEMTKRVGERFMDMIKRAITRQTRTSQFYVQTGALKYNTPPKSVTVNKRA